MSLKIQMKRRMKKKIYLHYEGRYAPQEITIIAHIEEDTTLATLLQQVRLDLSISQFDGKFALELSNGEILEENAKGRSSEEDLNASSTSEFFQKSTCHNPEASFLMMGFKSFKIWTAISFFFFFAKKSKAFVKAFFWVGP